jgi:DNA-binding CsgD family transcriptional regulator
LRIAAAAGRTIDDRLLVAASGLSADQVQRAVRAAVDDHILVRDPAQTGYRFRHEILRSLVAAQLLPDETRRIHAAYAQALADGPPDQRNATEIASHWDAAGEPGRALAAHLTAALAARAIYAYDEARRHLQRALELWDEVPDAAAVISLPRTTVLAAAASATAKAGDLARAIDLTRELIADPGAVDDETYELARSSLRWYLWGSGDIEAALAEAEAVTDDDPARWRANALAHRAGLLLYLRRTPQAARCAREAIALADAVDATEERILAEGVLGWCLLLDGDVEAGLAAIRRALDAAVTTESGRLSGRYPVGPVLAHSQLTTALELVGRFDEMHASAVGGAAVASRQGVARTFGSLLQAGAARALYQLGRWNEATLAVDEALRGGAVGAGRVALLAVRALLAVGRAEHGVLEQALAEAERLADDSTPVDVRRWLTVARAEDAIWRTDPTDALTRIALLADDPDAASGSGVRLGGQPAVPDASIPHLLVLGARACADLALQERADGSAPGISRMAAEQVKASLARVRRQRALATAWAGDLALARAELERSGQDVAARERRWKVAVDLVTLRPYAAAYALWRLAEARLARRDGRPDAATAIRQGLVLTEALGAARLGDELRSLAQRARLVVAAEADARVIVSLRSEQRPFGLTARETEVLVLLAQGLSNGEIADRLFISIKTASVHVSNIYSKLGVETRVAAATLAQGLDVGSLERPSPSAPRR